LAKKIKTARGLAVETLEKVEKNNSYSNLALNQTIKNSELNQSDINILTELIYGVLQRKSALDYQLKGFIKNPKKIDNWVKQLLRISLYQMEYLDRIPDYAVINEAVDYAKARGHKGISGFVNGVLRNITRSELASFEDIEPLAKRISIEQSLPEWLVVQFIDQYGEAETVDLAKSLNSKAKVSIRVNLSQISREDAKSQLAEEGFVTEESDLSPNGLISQSGLPVKSSLFTEGLITLQDETSMLVAASLQIEGHHKVLDACAAPGGKTTHIADYLDKEQAGQVTALDLHKHKVKLIEENAIRQNVNDKVDAGQMDARDVAEIFGEEIFDRVLVDAPCSGLGLMRRKPEIRYTKTQEDIDSLKKVQLAILDGVSKSVKKNGLLVYSTCTILEKENDEVVYEFLESHPEFRIKEVYTDYKLDKNKNEDFLTILPQYYDSDGFFISCLERI